MADPTYFTVVADFKSIIGDDVDAGTDPDIVPITGTVVFQPTVATGDLILATTATPRPIGFLAAPVTAIIDSTGQLKMRDDGTAVRLLADTPFLELSGPLYYQVTFSNVRYGSASAAISGFTFQAPNADTSLNLITVARKPGTPAGGITKLAPTSVRLVNGNQVQFAFGGVDIPDPFTVPYGPTGPTGPTGAAATIGVGTVTTGAVGSTATVANVGTSGAATLNFSIPRGNTGTAATVAVGTVTTGAVGSSATVTNTGNSGAAVFDFSIPRGATGNTGATGPTGPAGVTILGSVANYAALPGSATNGDAYIVVTDGLLYIRAAGAWPADGSGVPWRGPSATVYERFSQAVGDGTATSFVLSHNLNTRAVSVSVYNTSTWEEVEADVTLTSVNTVTVAFATAPTAGQYTVTVVAGGGSGDVTVGGVQTLTSKTLTSPRINQILDTNGANALGLSSTASAVNYVHLANAATGNGVGVFALGGDTNISLLLFGKGSGTVGLVSNGANALVASNPASSVNYFSVNGAATGNSPYIIAAGADSNIQLALYAKGLSGVGLYNGGGIAFSAQSPASSVNYIKAAGSATGNGVSLSAMGADANVALTLYSKGTASIYMSTGGGVGAVVAAPASAVNYLYLSGQVAGAAPYIFSAGTDTNIDLRLVTKGTGVVTANDVPVVTTTGTATLSNKTLTSPTINTPTITAPVIKESGGGNALTVNGAASSVNYLNITAAAAGGAPSLYAVGADADVTLRLYAKGAGLINLANGNGFGLVTSIPTSAVNYVQVTGSTTGNSVQIQGQGGDANVSLTAYAKGGGSVILSSGNGAALVASAPASAVNYATVSGAATGASPYIIASGTDTNISFEVGSKGTGSVNLRAGAGVALSAANVASAVNYVQVTGAVTGGGPTVSSNGSDASIGLNLSAKGTSGSVYLANANGVGLAVYSGAASTVNYVQVQGAATGSTPQINAAGNDANIPLRLSAKGTGDIRLQPAGVMGLQVLGSATAVNYLQTTASAAGAACTIGTWGSDTDVSINLTPKGAGQVQVNSNPVGVKVAVPATATSTGVLGQWATDASYMYVCTAANVWKRTALATW